MAWEVAFSCYADREYLKRPGEDVLTWIVPSKVRGVAGDNGCLLSPLHHHKVLQRLQAKSVAVILDLSLVVYVCQVEGVLDEGGPVEGSVPVLGRRDQL